jgi:hypothetical protein
MPRGGEHRGGGEYRGGGSVGGGSRESFGDNSVGRTAGRNNTSGRTDDARDKGDDVPRYSRPRDGQPATGTAVPRSPDSPVPTRGGGYVVVPGGYYGGFYDPWFTGGIGYYGGYYDPFYDPWYGGYPSYPTSSSTNYDEGSLKLKIKPKTAEVFVDGYYVGVVDEFDGLFQRLHIESGTHRIEVRATGYETLTFDVRISPDHTTTYQGEMKRIQ